VLPAHASEDPAAALAAARGHLEADPVAHNLPMTLLRQRVDRPEPGRYWWVTNGDDVVGFALQSPLEYKATVTPAARATVEVLVDAIFEAAPDLPGVVGEAATAACFAGRWAERAKVPAVPEEGQRLYVLTDVVPPVAVRGSLRPAAHDDADLLLDWNRAFCADIGQPMRSDAVAWIADNIDHERVFVWDDEGPASTAVVTDPVVGVSRVGFVYTPPARRAHGYAAAVVAGVSEHALRRGASRCMLYTQLSNPTSNAVYQRLGYRAVSEVLAYTFER